MKNAVWARPPLLDVDPVEGRAPCLVTFAVMPGEPQKVVEYWPLTGEAAPRRGARSFLLRIAGEGWLCGPLEGQDAAGWLRLLPSAFADCEVLMSICDDPPALAKL